MTPRHMGSGGFVWRSVEVCRVAVELSCRVAVEYPVEFLSSFLSSCRGLEARGLGPVPVKTQGALAFALRLRRGVSLAGLRRSRSRYRRRHISRTPRSHHKGLSSPHSIMVLDRRHVETTVEDWHPTNPSRPPHEPRARHKTKYTDSLALRNRDDRLAPARMDECEG